MSKIKEKIYSVLQDKYEHTKDAKHLNQTKHYTRQNSKYAYCQWYSILPIIELLNFTIVKLSAGNFTFFTPLLQY